ncbi:DNA double-strand break repair ATPase Rad50 [Archaeoglobus fulgidus]|jgi:exonuclease SbcC|uniref:DNA double-strand break repair Rad50 ATPase n=3 Tax=Archaeoglobus TaxID=2233 RepID=A0A075WD20_ARCFL|nr:DNA double-strand break repair ATPase Rad50 [Archaeoglobus fulgidus]AIG97911.1 ATPase involved in DNA repair [Archaeoglobus fulgidus DSM 8774]KUJ94024.1 MAG: DNA double-strand break repair Rad50 ATPase [Archaeoglobus fulgidus]KUK05914.1 MAG: DNA double-strand break repair Rad50 ATPase [Archaeoglobus fulgidus]
MILLKELQIKNFRSHSDSKIEFDTGINLIAGRNGAGKSSILEAILVAFYGLKPATLRKNDLVRVNSSGYSLSLTFSLNGDDYTISRKSNGESILTGKEIVEGDSNITEWVERHLCPAHVFTGAIYVRQGEIDSIIRDDESRERIIRQITRIEDYENAWKNLGAVIRMLEREKERLKEFLSQEEQIKRQKEEKKAEIERISEEIKSIESLREKLSEEVRNLESRLKELEEHKSRLESLRKQESSVLQEVRGLEEKLRELEKQLKEVVERIEDLEKKAKEVKELKPKAERYSILEKLLSEINQALRDVEKRERDLTREAAGIQAQLKKAEEDNSKLEEITKRIEELERELERFEKSHRLLETLKPKMDRMQGIKAKLEEKNLTPDKVEKMYDLLSKAKEEEKELTEKLKKLIAKKSSLKTRGAQLKKAVEELKSAERTCPVCGRELDEEHRKNIMAEYTREMKRIAEELAKADEIEKKLKERLEKVEKALEKQETVLKYRQMVDELKALENELSSHDAEKLSAESEEYRKVKERLDGLRGQQKILLSSASRIKELKSSLREIEEALKNVESERGELHRKIREEGFESLEELEREVQSLRPFYNKWLELKDAESRLESELKRREKLEDEISEAIAKLEEANGKAEEIRGQIDELLRIYSEEEHRRLSDEHLRKSKELAGLKSRLETLRESLQSAEKDLKFLEEQLAKMDEYRKKVEVFEKIAIPELTRIREKFRKYRNLVAENSMREVERYASQIFEELTEGKYSGVRLKKTTERGKEKLKVFVVYQGEEREIGFLSGGEIIALGLAFRLALSMFMIRGKIPLLILDEPTPFLDEERRRKLVDITTNYLRKIPQVIIVSHDEELKDAADKVIFVESQGGVSRVRYVEAQ